MKDTRTKEQKRFDRKQEILGTIMGIYMRNNHMKPLPIDEKTLNEIADHIAPFYVPLSQAEYEDFKATVAALKRNQPATHCMNQTLNKVLKKFDLFC
jgi:hypothetical protein